MTNPKVSVLIPAYKTQWLDAAIASVFSQTFTNYECIISDDSIGHEVQSIVNKWIQAGCSIQYYRNPKPDGVGYSNHLYLIEKAQGKYVKILHDDDILLPDSLGTLVALLDTNPQCKVAFHHRHFINNIGEIIMSPIFLGGNGHKVLDSKKFFDLYIARSPYNLIGEPSNVLYDAKVLKTLPYPFELVGRYMRYYWDVTLYLHIVCAGYNIVGHTKFLSCFRMTESQNSAEASKLFIYRLFERDLLRKWCAQNGYITEQQYQFLQERQINIYNQYSNIYPEFSEFYIESKKEILNHQFLTDNFLNLVRKVDQRLFNDQGIIQ